MRDSIGPTIKKRTLFDLLAIVIILPALLILAPFLQQLSLALLCNLATLCVLIVVIFTIRTSSRGIWSASSAYLVVFSIFHFGLTFVYGLDLPVSNEVHLYMSRWFDFPDTQEAIVLAILGLVSFCIGARFMRSRKNTSNQQMQVESHFSDSFAASGFTILTLCICAWFFILIQSGGLGLLVGSYEKFLKSTAGQPLPYVHYGIGVGMVFLAATPPSKTRLSGWVLFALWSLFALPIGLRGEVMIPALSALVISAKRKIPISTAKAIASIVISLVAIAAIKDLRQVGIGNYAISEFRGSPLEALAELGASLRPVTEVVSWKYDGEGFIYGASYWAPFSRAFNQVIPLVDQPAAVDDDRLLNVLVQRRVGPIGFSPVAEAYRNLGSFGVIIAMFLTGLTLGYLDTWAVSQKSQAVAGVLLVSLLLQVRNAFTPVPFQIITGVALLYIAIYIARLLKLRETRKLALPSELPAHLRPQEGKTEFKAPSTSLDRATRYKRPVSTQA